MSSQLTLKDCLSIGVGLIVGGGVITLTAFGIQYTGTGIFLAYFVAGIAFLFAMTPFIMVALTLPRTSASYFYTKELMSPMAGGLYLMSFFIGRVVMAFLGMSFALYFTQLFPDLKPHQSLVAFCVISLFFLLNLLGLKMVAQIQTLLNVILIASLVWFVSHGISYVNPNTFTTAYQFPKGWEGFIQAVALIMFPMGGALALFEFGGMIKNPRPTLTKAIIIISAMAMTLFALMGLAGSAILSPNNFTSLKTLADASKQIFNSGTGHIVFIAGGALMAIATTINSSFSWYCNTLIKGCGDGWLPHSWGKLNQFGVPYRLLSVCYALGIIPIILGADIYFLANIATGLALLAYIIPNFALLHIAKKYPTEWAQMPFSRLSNQQCLLLVIICNGLFIGLIGFNFFRFSPTVFSSIVAILILTTIYVYFQSLRLRTNQAMAIK